MVLSGCIKRIMKGSLVNLSKQINISELSMAELHTHTHYSNIKLIDSTNFVEDLILKCADMGKTALAITEHESIASHICAIKAVRRFKELDRIPSDFSLILGNEIYLCDSLEDVRDNYQSGVTKFPHFLLLAKNAKGHQIIRENSTKAWKQSFRTGFMERTPTIKKDLEESIRNSPFNLIGSSACLGSEGSIHILNGDYDKAKKFFKWCHKLFGENHFYLELQPGADGDQKIVNEKLVEFSKELGIDLILTSDSHYLRPEDAEIHAAFLNSKNEEREVREFYSNTYLHTNSEIFEKLSYLDEEIVAKAMENTNKIKDMIEDYTLEAPTVIPKIKIPNFELKHIFKKGYEQYSYIQKMAHSGHNQDRYLLYLIEKGFLDLLYKPDLSKEYFHQILQRIDNELEELWVISENMKQEMSSYYNTIYKIIELIWADDCGDESRQVGGIVGSGRGSASGFVINYLLGITSINPLAYEVEMPHWRHLHKSRDVDALDIDIDVPPHLRATIFERMKNSFGHEKVAQVCTYGTVASKSAVQTACRGLGIDVEIGQYISSLIPTERGENWSIKDCVEGNIEKNRKPVTQFINEINKYSNLAKVAMSIEGLIDKRSIHAGGIVVSNSDITMSNALQRAPNGTLVTQLNLDDTQATGSIKYDILGVSNISKLQLSLNMMLDEGVIEWQGTLRKTFNKYFHPDNLDLNNPKYYDLLSKGEIPDLFQFDTALANQALKISKPSNLIEMAAVNSIMRLMGDGDETPVETFARYKENIQLWYEEMNHYKLNAEEIKIMEEYLLPVSGIAETQELAMMFAMDKRIAGMGYQGANNIRKAIAKKSEESHKKAEQEFYDGGKQMGTRKELLDYIWKVQIGRQKNYSFSILHTIAYSIIGIQNIVIVADYSPIIWDTACLTVNSGSLEVTEGEKSKNTDYSKISVALSDLKSYGVKIELPLINSANFGFTPDVANNRIIFSLKGIHGIGDDIVREIIANRPYSSFDDFYERMYETKKIQRAHILALIKAGAFNEFNTPIEIMKEFLVKETPVKEALNGQNMSRVINLGLFNSSELKKYQDYFNFRSFLKKHVHKKLVNPKNRILIIKDEYSKNFFTENFSDESIYDFMGDSILIDEKEFEKEYKQLMKPAMGLLNDKEFIRQFNIAQFRELWGEHASGSVPQWEMESVSFYSDKHELEDANLEQYGVKDFRSLPEDPVVVGEYEYRGQTRYNYELCSIAGTVLDKNDNSHTVTLLTPTGVVTVKTWGGRFSFYNRQIKHNGKIVEKSWFTRGELLMFTGYRSNDLFILNAPKDQHTVNRITEIRDDGSLGLQNERFRA